MKSRASALLRRVIESGAMTREEMSRALETPLVELDSFLRNESVIPLTSQIELARVVIAKVPALARQAHTLSAQATAASRFRDGDTTVHLEPPGRWSALPRRAR